MPSKKDNGGAVLKKIIQVSFWLIFFNQSIWAEVSPDFAAIVKENADAVVAISVSEQNAGATKPAEPWMPENKSLGSGFVISEDGYILTNYHVIETADQIMVKFKNRQVLAAKVIGLDKATDLALLKVNALGLTQVKIGSVTSLAVGSWVIAIGSPFGFEQTVTKGIVSAKGRIRSHELYVPYIQTDTVINQGNSGGPLFNSWGMVVGVNSWIYTNNGGYEGMSFAIPIDVAMNVVQQLKSKGRFLRGWLGIATQEVPLELARSFSMSRAYGALISQISFASPAQKAGLMVGDIVVAFNNQGVENSAELPSKIGMVAAGEKVNLEIIRQGETKIVEVSLGLSPEDN